MVSKIYSKKYKKKDGKSRKNLSEEEIKKRKKSALHGTIYLIKLTVKFSIQSVAIFIFQGIANS